MKRPTYRQVADEAKVGTATVERVLNGRGGVTSDTAQRVVIAARKLGWGTMPTPHRGLIRIEVILVRPDSPFFSRLNKAFERISASLDPGIIIHRTFVEESDAAAIARHIANPSFRRAGLIVVAQESRVVRESLEKVRRANVEIVQIVTRQAGVDLPYVGIDNYAVGRTAAYYMSGMMASVRGTMLAICHSWAYEAQTERIRGFSDYLRVNPNPNHSFPLVMFGYDSDVHYAEAFDEAFRRYDDVIGIYNAGGGENAIAAQLEKRRSGQHVYWVNHELNDKTKRWLKTGLMSIALDQAPEIQARRALDTILKNLGIIDVEVSTDPVQFVTSNAESF